MILCVTLNPVVDTTLFVDEIKLVYRTEAHRLTHVAGGKGNNVARALIGLGQPARALVPLGGVSGRHEGELLAADGIETVIARFSGETRVAVTVVDRDLRQRAFFAPASPFTQDDVDRVRERFAEALEGVSAVCLCGSSPGPLADVLYPELLRVASARGILTLLDTYGEALRLGLEARPTILKVNRAEAAILLERELDTVDEQVAALDALRGGGAEWAILTLGGEGALFAYGDQCWLGRSPEVEVVNPIGSGDAMTAGLLAGWVRDQSPEECFRLGMAAAVANTMRWDAGRITAADTKPLLARVAVRPL